MGKDKHNNSIYTVMKNCFKLRISILFVFILLLVGCLNYILTNQKVEAEMPFYGLNVSELAERSRFSTVYAKSSNERKSNIKLASKSINNYFLDVGAEFSFNKVVGARTTSRGYKTAKIIEKGKFVDGVGGGVCQVSTTLYNAVLLAGLTVTEFHPHSLPVSYVLPSFDAMVNSGSADLKFVNTSNYPIIICTEADGEKLTVSVWGAPKKETYERKSVVLEDIIAEKEEEIIDEKGEYPDLYEGEYKFIAYSKNGYKSEGYLIKIIDGKEEGRVRLRKDSYMAQRGVVIRGTAERPEDTDGFYYFTLKEKLLKYLGIN